MDNNMINNPEQNTPIAKKKSPLPFIIAGVAALVVVAAAVIVLVFLRGGAASKKYSKQLQIADKYMTDMDYKNAVLAYNEAISINPGKADAYLGLADAYLAMGKTKKAIKALEQGLDNVTDEDGREQIQEKLDEIEDEETSEPGPKDKPKEETSEPAESEIDYVAVYKPILDQVYDVAMNGYDYDKGYENVSGGIIELASWETDLKNKIKYVIWDISGDGVPELLIGYDNTAYQSGEEYSTVLSGYTCVDGKPVCFLECWARSSCDWMGNGYFRHMGSNSAWEGTMGKCHVSKDGTKLIYDELYHHIGDDVTGETNFYYNTTGEYGIENSQKLDFTWDDYSRIENGYHVELLPWDSIVYYGK